MNDKYKKMVKTHSSVGYDDLIEDLGEDILPAEYGGKNSNIAELTEFWKEEVTKQSDWLINQSKFKTNESLRTGKSRIQFQFSIIL